MGNTEINQAMNKDGGEDQTNTISNCQLDKAAQHRSHIDTPVPVRSLKLSNVETG